MEQRLSAGYSSPNPQTATPELSAVVSGGCFVVGEVLGPVICGRYHHTY